VVVGAAVVVGQVTSSQMLSSPWYVPPPASHSDCVSPSSQ
jgi:hypothetical protein